MLPTIQPEKLFEKQIAKHEKVVAVPINFGAYMSLIDVQAKADEMTAKEICAEFTSKVCRLPDLETSVDGNDLTDDELAQFIESYIRNNPELFIFEKKSYELPRNKDEDTFEYFKRVFLAYMGRENERFSSSAAIAAKKIRTVTDLSSLFKKPADINFAHVVVPKNLDGIINKKSASSAIAVVNGIKSVSPFSKSDTVKGHAVTVHRKLPEIKLPQPLAVETNALLNKTIQEHSNTNMKLDVLITQIEESRKESDNNFTATTTQNDMMIDFANKTYRATLATLLIAFITLVATIYFSSNSSNDKKQGADADALTTPQNKQAPAGAVPPPGSTTTLPVPKEKKAAVKPAPDKVPAPAEQKQGK